MRNHKRLLPMLCILEPVFTRNICGFSSIILLQTRQKYAGGLSVAIHPSATLLCSRAESCLERSRPASIFHAVCSKICRKDTCIRLWRQVLISNGIGSRVFGKRLLNPPGTFLLRRFRRILCVCNTRSHMGMYGIWQTNPRVSLQASAAIGGERMRKQ